MTTSLAPGFRFHPTDEELVSYYLKRKVLSKPLRVDAISEIDLYKSEPWDLPEKSRIRSRDVEWYFFSRLDKKYSNRSRTNRTTGHGYWKTTGKDRPVKKGSRIVGMKKTLVFHSGRAPKGARTNWVMHEYRLEDEELAKDVQDGYVVCRIFQKSGSGPQNGAQYGAPFVEAEWENDDADVMVVVSGEEVASGSGEPQLALFEYLVQESKIVDIKTENHHGPLEVPHGVDNVPNSLSNVVHPGVPSICPVEVYQHQQLVHLGSQNVSTPQVHDSQTLVESEDNFAMSAWPVGVPNDDYLELNDFYNSSVREVFIRMRDDQGFSSVSDQPTNLLELGGVEEFFNNTNEIVQQTSEADVAYADNFCLEMDGANPFANEYASGENSMMPYHAPDDNLQFESDCFFEPNEFLDPPDKIDDLLAYFDATEDDLQYSYFENLGINSSDLGPSHVDRELAENKVELQDSVAHGGAEASAKMPGDEDEKPSQKVDGYPVKSGAEASAKMPGDEDEKPSQKVDDYPVKSGSASEKDWEKTITGRLVGFLGSISSPPALAAEFPRQEGKAVDFNSAAQPSSSVHVTAGIIRIDGLTMRKDESQWPVQKTEDVSFLLSYSMAKADSASNLGKMHCNAISMMIRSGFCLSLFSILCLALSYKIGICICAR